MKNIILNLIIKATQVRDSLASLLGENRLDVSAVKNAASEQSVSNVNNLIGLLANLDTTDKTSIVNAINEVRGALAGFGNLSDSDIDTLEEINTILIDANLLSQAEIEDLIIDLLPEGVNGIEFLNGAYQVGGSFSSIELENLSGLPRFFINTGFGTYRRVNISLVNGNSWGGFEYSDTDGQGTDQTNFYANYLKFVIEKIYQGHKFELNANGISITLGTGGNFSADKDFREDYTSFSFVQKIWVESVTGLLSNLTTTDKTNLVSAINELKSALAGVGNLSDTDIDTLAEINAILGDATLMSESQVQAITGLLADLNTTDKSSLVSAINEVLASAGAKEIDKASSNALTDTINFSTATFQPKTHSGSIEITTITNPALGLISLPIVGGNDVTIDTDLIPADRIRGAFNAGKGVNILKIICYDAATPEFYAVWDLEGGSGGSALNLLEYKKTTNLAVTTTIGDITSFDDSPININSEGVTVNETTGVVTLAANANYSISVSANYVAVSGATRSTVDVQLTEADNSILWEAYNYIRDAGDKNTISFSKTIQVGGTDLEIKFRHIISKGGAMSIELSDALIKIQKI
jgi:hypothetical protein